MTEEKKELDAEELDENQLDEVSGGRRPPFEGSREGRY
jgi:bacteriocin-like protein